MEPLPPGLSLPDGEVRSVEYDVFVKGRDVRGYTGFCPILSTNLYEYDNGSFVDNLTGDIVSIDRSSLLDQAPGFLIAQLAPIKLTDAGPEFLDEPALETAATALEQSLATFFASCGTIVERRVFDTALSLRSFMADRRHLYSHVVLIGHGQQTGLHLLDESDIDGAGLADLLGCSTGCSPLQVLSLCCHTGCENQARTLSAAEGISSVLAPDGTCDLRWATLFVQSYLLHYYESGLDVAEAMTAANQSPELVPIAIWRDGARAAS